MSMEGGNVTLHWVALKTTPQSKGQHDFQKV